MKCSRLLKKRIKQIINLGNYKVSIIIPVYNTGRYLEEALDSVYNQTIGLNNIQIILINDGSTDNSAAICRAARKRHKKNVVFLQQSNRGVSAARNYGLRFVKGKYVTFMDSDDTLDCDFLKRLYDYIEKHNDSIDLVVGRLCYFEKKDGFHHKLDYKFKKSCIVDLQEKPEYVQQHVCSALFKSKYAKELRFDESLKMGEDVLYVSEYLSKRLSYGIVKNAIYNYRIREDETAASSNYLLNRESFDGIIDCYDKVIKISERLFGSLIPYYQNVIMFDLQFRIANELPDVFVDINEKNDYVNGVIRLLKKIDDSVILKQRSLLQGYKIYALSLKYGYNITDKSTIHESILYFKGNSYLDLRNHLKILSVKRKEGGLEIQGRQSYSIIKNTQVCVRVKESNLCVPVTDNKKMTLFLRLLMGILRLR